MTNEEKIKEFKKIKVNKPFKHEGIDINITEIGSEVINGVLALKVVATSPQVEVSQPICIVNPPNKIGTGIFDDMVVDGKTKQVERMELNHEKALTAIIGSVYKQKKDKK